MPLLCGADGCKNGWVFATCDTISEKTSVHRAFSVKEIIDGSDKLAVLAIDVPIGLPNEGPRACDVEARAMLGRPRGSSVFPAPIRPMLSAVSHAHASRIGRENDGRGLTIQCWHILPKIQEVDTHLRSYPSDRARVREIHPEVSFMILAGRPMTHPKRKKAGRLERVALLKPVFDDIMGEAIQNRRALGAKPDDIIDAFVALWSAKRIFDHSSISLPSASQQTDSKGIVMEIVA